MVDAGVDPMYAYRYLSWRLNCPHWPEDVKALIKGFKTSPQTVFNYLGDRLIEEYGTNVDDNEIKDYITKRILEEGSSWGHWPKAPKVGEWFPYGRKDSIRTS